MPCDTLHANDCRPAAQNLTGTMVPFVEVKTSYEFDCGPVRVLVLNRGQGREGRTAVATPAWSAIPSARGSNLGTRHQRRTVQRRGMSGDDRTQLGVPARVRSVLGRRQTAHTPNADACRGSGECVTETPERDRPLDATGPSQ